MFESKLSNFIKEWEIEYNYTNDEILLFIYHFQLDIFMEIIEDSFFDDIALVCDLTADYLVIDITPLCDFYGVDFENIIKKEGEK